MFRLETHCLRIFPCVPVSFRDVVTTAKPPMDEVASAHTLWGLMQDPPKLHAPPSPTPA